VLVKSSDSGESAHICHQLRVWSGHTNGTRPSSVTTSNSGSSGCVATTRGKIRIGIGSAFVRARFSGAFGAGPLPGIVLPRFGKVPLFQRGGLFIRYNRNMNRLCDYCGASIMHARSDARFCGSKCRVYSFRKSGKLPAEMVAAPRWIRRTANKVPLTVNGVNASSTNPATWSDYSTAVASPYGVGLGFVLGGGFACIDLDHCIVGGELTQTALGFIARYPRHYIEISPSGDGLHIWGTAPEAAGTRVNLNGLSVETYSAGRYITVTGNVYQAGELLPL
jgi:hypothetical protein